MEREREREREREGRERRSAAKAARRDDRRRRTCEGSAAQTLENDNSGKRCYTATTTATATATEKLLMKISTTKHLANSQGGPMGIDSPTKVCC